MTIGLPRLDDPVIYTWNLTEDSPRFDYPRARANDDATLRLQFIILATINAIVAVVSGLLIISIVRSKKVWSNSFKLYLLFISLPDFLAAIFCVFTCASSAPKSEYISEAMCGFQSFYLVFNFTTNAWLNGIIVNQIHVLLKHSNIRRRYTSPTHRRVMCHAAAVYSYAIAVAMFGAFNIPHLPYQAHLYYGVACGPMEYDRASTFTFWLFLMPCMLGIPVVLLNPPNPVSGIALITPTWSEYECRPE
jgi:hypothetical protein